MLHQYPCYQASTTCQHFKTPQYHHVHFGCHERDLAEFRVLFPKDRYPIRAPSLTMSSGSDLTYMETHLLNSSSDPLVFIFWIWTIMWIIKRSTCWCIVSGENIYFCQVNDQLFLHVQRTVTCFTVVFGLCRIPICNHSSLRVPFFTPTKYLLLVDVNIIYFMLWSIQTLEDFFGIHI